jgi:hypothetical protein
MQTPFNRRFIVAGLGAMIANALTGKKAEALELCPAQGYPPNSCSAMIDPHKFVTQRVYSGQPPNSQWCWAACVSMICKWHGYEISQPSIVQQTYGSIVNMPADDRTLTGVLNRVLRADDGRRFRITARIFNPVLGLDNLTNEQIIDDLRNDKPLLYAARTHAMVLARADYFPTPNGPDIRQGHVVDPYPGVAPPPYYARFLAQDELRPPNRGGSLRYLASVRVEPA